jgi:vanillate O-demethylase ferredoxin subunit
MNSVSGVQPATIEVAIKAIRPEAEGIVSLEFQPRNGGDLPAFAAGAHIDLYLPNGLSRSYSLFNPPTERHRYVVAVNRDEASRGGSVFVHDKLRAGDTLTISAPRNNFPLDETAPHTVLIAGGIGITPLWCMVQRLQALGRSWELHYGTRTRRKAAFVEALAALGGALALHVDDEAGGKVLDVPGIVVRARPDAHFYCCGPLPMLAAFEAATASRPAAQVHVEYFSARDAVVAEGGFTVELAKSGRSFAIPAGKTILDVLLDANIPVSYSCMEGICASCETRVLAGVPDHRDMILSDAEKASNTVMMICCSGCKGDKLVLDL